MPGGNRGGGGGGGISRGKKNYKGQRRHFTDEDELKNQIEKDEREKNWRKQRGIESEEEEEDDDAKRAKNKDMPASESSSSGSESEEEEEKKAKGVEHLIEVHNPNRTGAKANKKIGELAEGGGATQLSRREREEIEKQEAKRRYQALHAQGKTDEAQADLARLAIIKQKREDAAKKKAEEQKAKDDAKAAKSKS